MAKDVIGFKNVKKGEPWFRDDGTITAVSGKGNILLIQSWNVTYQQQVTPLYECGTSTVYFSSKHQAGQLTIDKVWTEELKKMKEVLGEICTPQSPTVRTYKCDNVEIKATLKECFVTGINLSGQSQQGHVGENITCQFAWLEDS